MEETNHFQSKPFYYRLYGDYALFTDPVTKGGGEKFTYQIPTYQAIKGITEQIYWKPTIYIVIDELVVMNRIVTETMGARPIITTGKKPSNDLSNYTYLRDVDYLIKFHFEWNLNRPDLAKDRNEFKHQAIILRSLERGGRRSIFLGTSECMGFVERLSEKDYYETARESYYKQSNVSYGIMFHSFTYPDEQIGNEAEDDLKLYSNYTPIQMKKGKISFCRPEDCQMQQVVNNYHFKTFNEANMILVDEEYQAMGLKGAEQ
ncbi:type I-C CRISPR-associated protein Cas5c [Aerococcus tenax]|uniref:type I-C CRISPR-associated protein Cas5c n=1 Tax=Aerococcus tenax TaxID=3078812 RepID=UPI0018A6D96B|nr:type I-C CRISPR-associated protein Cas5c [Aerococcus tenax]